MAAMKKLNAGIRQPKKHTALLSRKQRIQKVIDESRIAQLPEYNRCFFHK
jgi:hypothetical protein